MNKTPLLTKDMISLLEFFTIDAFNPFPIAGILIFRLSGVFVLLANSTSIVMNLNVSRFVSDPTGTKFPQPVGPPSPPIQSTAPHLSATFI